MDKEVAENLGVFWKVYFYMNLLNGWVILPIYSHYTKSGEFSVIGWIFKALKKYLKFLIICLIILVLSLMIILIGLRPKLDFREWI